MPYELPKDAAQRARAEFQRALESSMPANVLWQLKLFDESEEDHIRKEVERKLYEPTLPNGGDRERRIIERLKKISRLKDFADAWQAGIALNAWSKVLPEDPRNSGRYYIRRPMLEKRDKAEFKWFKERQEEAKKNKQWEKVWFYELMLDGPPEAVSNFELECLYLLKRADGLVSRLVRLKNLVGETTAIVDMDSEAFHAPQKFRKWCLEQGNFTWGAGEKELQRLHNDVAQLTAWKVVNQVVTLGWLPLAKHATEKGSVYDGIWFLGDCARANAWTKDGIVDEWLQADEDGIYWHRHENSQGETVEEGYQLADSGRENPFVQKLPMFHPHTKIADANLDLAEDPTTGFKGQKGVYPNPDLEPAKAQAIESELMVAFFRELCRRTYRQTGDVGAYLLIGSFFSYAVAPEIFGEHSLFPGIWVHGQASSGKSLMCEWMMELWGFNNLPNGVNLRSKNSSAVGLMQAADQYSNLPVWLDEFKSDILVGEDKLSVIQNAYNRGGQVKFNPSRIQRLMRTSYVISGESTSNQPSIRSRFPHIQMSKHLRVGTQEEQRENLQWFNKHRKYFYFFGRYIIEHRRRFVAAFNRHMESWEAEQIDPRIKYVHGVAYASWMAMVQLLGSHGADEVNEFRKYAVEHSLSAETDVESEHDTNVFIQDLIAAWEAGEIGRECFRVTSTHASHPPGYPSHVGGWNSYTLWIEPRTTMLQLAIYLRKAGRTITLKETDLRDQLSKNDFWVKRQRRDQAINMRFGKLGKMGVKPAWGILADFHPLGLQKNVTDEEWEEFLQPKDGQPAADPHKGPLFSLIEGIVSKEREEARAQSDGRKEAPEEEA